MQRSAMPFKIRTAFKRNRNAKLLFVAYLYFYYTSTCWPEYGAKLAGGLMIRGTREEASQCVIL